MRVVIETRVLGQYPVTLSEDTSKDRKSWLVVYGAVSKPFYGTRGFYAALSEYESCVLHATERARLTD